MSSASPSPKMNDHAEDKQPQENNALSFSINRILSTTDDKKTSDDTLCDVDNARISVVSNSSINRYGHGADTSHYHQFEMHAQTRACSTPEFKFPSPTTYFIHPGYRQIHGYNHVLHPTANYALGRSLAIPQFYTRTNQNECHGTQQKSEIPLKSNIVFEDAPSDKSLDSIGDSYHQSPSPLKSKKKKSRTVFSRRQVYHLESAFESKRYLSSTERASLAISLNLSETQIKIWFQNRRNKWKRQINGEMDEIMVPPAFAAGLLSSTYGPPSTNALNQLLDSREGSLRGALNAPGYYAHPYTAPSTFQRSNI